MTGEEALARIRSKLQQTTEETPAVKALIEKIRSGNATYEDTALYARWAAINLGMSLSDVICDIDLSDRAAVCKALLLDQYEDINGFIDMVQAELDSRFGIQLAPHRAPFNGERADTIGHSLADTTRPDEVIRRRAHSATETAVKSMHDDRMKSEAKFRHSVGLDCHIIRVAVNGCCPWCSKVAGRYRYGEEPDDIYRRHDNCDCTVTFENGRKRHDVWSKRTWEVPGKDAGAAEPTVLTAEQAAEIEAKHQPTVLTNEHGKRIIKLSINLFSPSDGIYLDAFSIEEEPGYEDVHLHGSPTSVQIRRDGKLVNVSAQEFALILRANGYRGGDIRLCSCSTGQGEDSFAQQLSKVLGCRVKAPDSDLFYIPEDGVMFVGSCFSNTGKWRVFSKGDEVT